MKEHYSNHLLIKHPKLTNLQGHPLLNTLQNSRQKSQTGQATTTIIGWILRCGVILSASITLIGMLLLLSHPGALSTQSLDSFPHTLSQVWIGLLSLQPQAIIALGLLLLIATPVVSVTASIIAFAIEHDRLYMIIALIVLATLITSFLIGKGR